MNIAQIENNLQTLVKAITPETFIYDLLLAYGLPKATITRLQQGNLNLSDVQGEVLWKKKLFFKVVQDEDLHRLIEKANQIDRVKRQDPRFIIVTDFNALLAIDRKTSETLDIPLLNIVKNFDFFLPWAGMEKAQHKSENPADVKAAEKMAKLYDEIKKDNPTKTPEQVHNLNVFLSRLLFCFFAEDTDIFKEKQFTHAVSNHTQTDGTDLNNYLTKLFDVMNTPVSSRGELPVYLNAFPYVNGGLFSGALNPIIFTRRSRQAIINSGELDWSAINPDIFGSMIQAVITPEHRGGLGMHYTSVPNIMKVIEPLFLNELNEEFEAGKYEPKRLNKLLERIGKIKIFDPACGSGNFLIIAYKELRLLEIKILQQLQTLQHYATGFEPYQLELIPKAQLTLAASFQPSMFSRIELSQFYGIELDDFAHEIAILSLWLAQHQMNLEFKEIFGSANPTLPLQTGGNIVHGNATEVDWENVCSIKNGDETYILGNPPYLGFSLQSKGQKLDIVRVFGKKIKLDYITCWFIKASNYISNSNSRFAFVTTNSICQGEQVALLWPSIFKKGLEIDFAYPSFKWENNAKGKAAVVCAIIGVRNKSVKKKKLFVGDRVIEAKNINAYLTIGNNLIIERLSKPLSNLPEMILGNCSFDGGNLILPNTEKDKAFGKTQGASKFIRKIIGAAEFMQKEHRWCLWIENEDLSKAEQIPEISRRISATKKMRVESPDSGTNKLSSRPHQFRDRINAKSHSILVPRVGSSRRRYIPCGFIDKEYIIGDSAQVIYDSEIFVFAILSSYMHILWVKAVAGYLKSDYRYSSVLCYNTFPFPLISASQKSELEKHVYEILEVREGYPEKTIAQLYDPDKMPSDLRDAHNRLDLAIEKCYRSKPFERDEERLEYLFNLYEQMMTEVKVKGSLFENKKKSKKNLERYA